MRNLVLIILISCVSTHVFGQSDNIQAQILCRNYAVGAATAVATVNDVGAVYVRHSIESTLVDTSSLKNNKIAFGVAMSQDDKTKVYQVDANFSLTGK